MRRGGGGNDAARVRSVPKLRHEVITESGGNRVPTSLSRATEEYCKPVATALGTDLIWQLRSENARTGMRAFSF